MIKVDMQSRTPIYLQVEGALIELILLGELKENDQLPSVRNMARDLGINPNTIQKAYQELESQGIIYSATGRGNFVASPTVVSGIKQAQHLKSLRQTLGDVKIAGVKKDDVLHMVDEVFYISEEATKQ